MTTANKTIKINDVEAAKKLVSAAVRCPFDIDIVSKGKIFIDAKSILGSPSVSIPAHLAYQLGKITAAQFFRNKKNLQAAFSMKSPCNIVGLILKFFHSLKNTLPFFIFHITIFVKYIRNYCFRHSCFSCNIFSRYFLSSTLHCPVPFRMTFLIYTRVYIFLKDYTDISACVIFLIILRKLLPLHRKEHNYQLVFLHSHRSQQMISAAVHNSL